MVKIRGARFATFLQTLAGQVKEVKEQERQKVSFYIDCLIYSSWND